jgi:hypothetical protein
MNLKQGLKKTGKVVIIVAVMIVFTVGLFAQASRAGFTGKDMRPGRGMMGPDVSGLFFLYTTLSKIFLFSLISPRGRLENRGICTPCRAPATGKLPIGCGDSF